MLTFSQDPEVAEQEMYAIIFYLTVFGYVDGEFSLSEKSFVRNHIRVLVEKRVTDTIGNAATDTIAEVTERFVTHFHEVFQTIDESIRSFFTEVVARGENVEDFVYSKLKLRSYEIFCSFDTANQQALLETLEELIYADGKAHTAELKFRDELKALLRVPNKGDVDVTDAPTAAIDIQAPVQMPAREEDYEFFQAFETPLLCRSEGST